MATFIASYRSPAGVDPVSGMFEFESQHNAGTKQNIHDARMVMLTAYGSQAVAWQIYHVERKKAQDNRSDHQLELDFRDPVETPKRKKRSFDRGISSKGVEERSKGMGKHLWWLER